MDLSPVSSARKESPLLGLRRPQNAMKDEPPRHEPASGPLAIALGILCAWAIWSFAVLWHLSGSSQPTPPAQNGRVYVRGRCPGYLGPRLCWRSSAHRDDYRGVGHFESGDL